MEKARLLPESEESEWTVLSCILQDQSALPRVIDQLDSGDFYSTRNKLIFRAMVYLNKKGVPIDFISITGALKSKGFLENAGGVDHISFLEDYSPTMQVLDNAIDAVRNTAIQRSFIKKMTKQIDAAYQTDSPSDVVQSAFAEVFEFTQQVQGRDKDGGVLTPDKFGEMAFDNAFDKFKNPNATPGLLTGMSTVDNTLKGLRDMTIISASTGIGKTCLGLNWATEIGIMQNIPCLYLNYEMNKQELADRILGILTGVDVEEITTGEYRGDKSEKFQKVADWSDVIKERNLLISDNKPKTINSTLNIIQNFKVSHGIKIVFIDYLGEIERDKQAYKENSEYITFGRWSQQLKNFCADRGIKLVLLAQLNRDGDDTPNKNRVGGSWKLAQQCDAFIILYKEIIKNIDPGGPPEIFKHFLRIDKNRHGRQPVTIEVDFNKSNQRIVEL